MNGISMERFGNLSNKEFAARCRAARGYLDLNLDDIAAKVGVSRQALSRREAGAVKVRPVDRFVMASVYAELTGWPLEFFTDEKLPPMGLTSPGEDGEGLEPGEVVRLIDGPPSSAELP